MDELQDLGNQCALPEQNSESRTEQSAIHNAEKGGNPANDLLCETTEEKMTIADALDAKAERMEAQADLIHVVDPERAEQIYEQKQDLEIQAAEFRECEKGVREQIAQHAAGEAAQALVDYLGDVPLPGPVDAVRDAVLPAIRGGIDDVAEKAVELNQDFTDWLRDKLGL